MLINPGEVRTWLYTSKLKDEKSHDSMMASMEGFRAKNHSFKLSGFLITNGRAVMQLLEGDDNAVETLKAVIMKDDRHLDIVTEVWELEAARAYPDWSMRAMRSENYEALFGEIQTARISTIATNIAQMLFDTTFDGEPACLV